MSSRAKWILCTTLIFLDANAPMYSAGRPHPLKAPSIQVLRLVQDHRSSFVTSAEIFQELVHRYLAIREWAIGRALFDGMAALMQGRIQPIYFRDVQEAANLADTYPTANARDLLHVAVMNRLEITRIVSTDKDFDGIPGIERLDPMLVDEWAHVVTESR